MCGEAGGLGADAEGVCLWARGEFGERGVDGAFGDIKGDLI